MSDAHLAMFASGSDPLAAAMGGHYSEGGSGGGEGGHTTVAAADPLGLALVAAPTPAVDDPLGLGQMLSQVTVDAPAPLPPPHSSALDSEMRDEAAAKGVDVARLEALAAAGDKAGVTAALKAAGYKTGGRLKLEAVLFGGA